MNSTDVLDALCRSLEGQGYVVVREVMVGSQRNRTERRADAIAVQLYESRGVHLHAFEVKVSRADWMRELREPAKADPIATGCRYYTIIAPQGVVDPLEVPLAWGLWQVRAADGKVMRTRAGQPNEDARFDVSTMARILRRAYDAILAPGADALKAAEQKGWKEGHEAGKRDAARPEGEDYRERYNELVEAVTAFQQASGVDLGARWYPNPTKARRTGEAVRLLMEQPHAMTGLRRALLETQDRIARMVREVEAASEPIDLRPAEPWPGFPA